MMSSSPVVSVIMGFYNAEKTLAASIESILCQGFSDFEFILCDDGSTDNSYSVALEFQQKDDRIILLKNEVNIGLAGTLNRCLEVCRGSFVARQDADDISNLKRLTKMLRFIEDSGADFAGCGVRLFDINTLVDDKINITKSNATAHCGERLAGTQDENGYDKCRCDNKIFWGERIFPQLVAKKTLVKYNAFTHPTLVFKTDVLRAVGGYREASSVYRCEDYDLVMRLYAAGFYGKNMPGTLVDYYENRNSYKKHSIKSRLCEFKTRFYGYRKMRVSFFYYIYCFKPLLLLLIPKRLYKKLHNKKWRHKEPPG